MGGVFQAFEAQGIWEMPMPRLSPTLLHLIVVGGITQIIFGVSYWMFPLTAANRDRGNEKLGYFVLFALNFGILLRVCSEPFLVPDAPAVWVYLLSAGLQAAAALAYAILIWPRVRGIRPKERHAGS